MKTTTAVKLVMDELERAEKHGDFASAHEGYAVLLEEVDELWAEVKANQGTTHRGVSEAVQVAAMGLKYLICLCDEATATAHDNKVAEHLKPRPYVVPSRGGGYSG